MERITISQTFSIKLSVSMMAPAILSATLHFKRRLSDFSRRPICELQCGHTSGNSRTVDVGDDARRLCRDGICRLSEARRENGGSRGLTLESPIFELKEIVARRSLFVGRGGRALAIRLPPPVLRLPPPPGSGSSPPKGSAVARGGRISAPGRKILLGQPRGLSVQSGDSRPTRC
jgi:hypothetical protein